MASEVLTKSCSGTISKHSKICIDNDTKTPIAPTSKYAHGVQFLFHSLLKSPLFPLYLTSSTFFPDGQLLLPFHQIFITNKKLILPLDQTLLDYYFLVGMLPLSFQHMSMKYTIYNVIYCSSQAHCNIASNLVLFVSSTLTILCTSVSYTAAVFS